jgi:flavin-dependent dehydrogenase
MIQPSQPQDELQEHDEQQETWDAIVVGASFAGLAFASAAAARGMRVLVLERDATPGGIVRTTGVLFSDVLDVLDVPSRYLMNAVRRLRIQAPDQPPLEVGGKAWRFYMADVTGMLGWMAENAREHGAQVRCGVTFADATREADGRMRVTYSLPTQAANDLEAAAGPWARGEIYAQIVIGADGARSSVAKRLNLDQNTYCLAGAEWLVEGVPLDGETFYLVMDHALAPGYCLWLAPHGDIAALGVAGRQREFKPNESLKAAQAIFADVADLGAMRVRERKGGVIPVGGQLRRVYRDDGVGRALLLGDAAGLCGAATGGGIYPALICGRLAAHAVANEILNGTEGAIRAYLRDLPQAGRLGHYLKIERWLRLALDRANSNADLSAFYGLFATPAGKQVLQRTLFETPIISMDSSFFALLRTLLSKRPALYGSALRVAWQRVVARS